MSKTRLDSIDMARGVSILLVAAFHAKTEAFFNVLLTDLRMPLFFLISGFLFSQKYIVSPHLLIKNRVKTLLIPYFSAAFLFYLFFVLRTIIDKDDFSLVRAFVGIFYGISPDYWLIVNVPLWFLLCLFCTQVIFSAVLKLIGNKNIYLQLLIFLLISISGVLIGKIVYLPWSIDKALVFQIFVFAGYKFKEIGILDKFKPVSFVTLVMIMIFALVTYINTTVDVGIFNDTLLMYVAGVSGSIVVIKLVSLLSPLKWVSKTLSYIGRESLTILIFHGGLFIYAAGVITYRIGFNIHWVIAWIISIVGSLVIAEIIKKIPIANFLLNGKSMDKPMDKPKVINKSAVMNDV